MTKVTEPVVAAPPIFTDNDPKIIKISVNLRTTMQSEGLGSANDSKSSAAPPESDTAIISPIGNLRVLRSSYSGKKSSSTDADPNHSPAHKRKRKLKPSPQEEEVLRPDTKQPQVSPNAEVVGHAKPTTISLKAISAGHKADSPAGKRVKASGMLEDPTAKPRAIDGKDAHENSSAASTPKSRSSSGTKKSAAPSSQRRSPRGQHMEKVVASHTTTVCESNNPGEDRHCEQVLPEEDLSIFVILDGHGGSLASQYASEALIPELLSRLKPEHSNEDVVKAITDTFLICDDNFLSQLDANTTEIKGYWNAGSCAILALVRKGFLFVAHTGDCRAVLGVVADDEKAGGTSTPSPTHNSILRKKTDTSAKKPVTGLPLSLDHNCGNKKEIQLVKARCMDKKPIRMSVKDARYNSKNGIDRVAGSLAVTRALGDAYLKRKNLSFEPYKQYVPYITAEPEVTVHKLNPKSDRFLILATDGLWERLENDEAVTAVYESMQEADRMTDSSGKEEGKEPSLNSSDTLVEKVLSKAAAASGISVRTLKRLRKGTQRRMIHDDICVTVVHFVYS